MTDKAVCVGGEHNHRDLPTGNVIGDADEQTLTNKEVLLPIATHDFGAGSTDWELSEAEQKKTVLRGTNAGVAVAIIATPTDGKVFAVKNGVGFSLTIKASGQTGVSVADGTTALVIGNGTDFERLTADA